jgi:hypothetical protein
MKIPIGFEINVQSNLSTTTTHFPKSDKICFYGTIISKNSAQVNPDKNFFSFFV